MNRNDKLQLILNAYNLEDNMTSEEAIKQINDLFAAPKDVEIKFSTPEKELEPNSIVFHPTARNPVLKLCPNGDIFVNGKLAKNDLEVVEGMKDFLKGNSQNYGYLFLVEGEGKVFVMGENISESMELVEKKFGTRKQYTVETHSSINIVKP